jgi:magnesium chelatase family protein
MQIYAPLTSEQNPELQRIEIASSFQLPGFHIIGLPSPEVAEAKERIRAALESSGFELPKRRVVLNLSPASIRKRGTGLDLAMALAVLTLGEADASGSGRAPQVAAWGELGLDGSIKSAGQPSRALYATWECGIDYLLVSPDDFDRMKVIRRWIETARMLLTAAPVIVPVSNLQDAWECLDKIRQKSWTGAENSALLLQETPQSRPADISSQLLPLSPSLERTVSIAAAGQHHLMLLGAKGVGKSHALEWLIHLQPESPAQLKVHRALLSELRQSSGSLGGMEEADLCRLPVRRVSSTVRPSALIGNATSQWIRPGEFSLAHGGLLIADEFPEWSRDSREALREPLERGKITVTRAKGSIEYPARFAFAANGNFCPCGGWPPEYPIPFELQQEKKKVPRCRCGHRQRNDYKARLSGPILDRIDLLALVGSHLPPNGARTKGTPDLLEILQDKVRRSQEIQLRQWGSISGLLGGPEVEALVQSHPAWEASLERLMLGSLRTRHKTIRIALTLAAWDETEVPEGRHFIEASTYRPERFGLCD